MDLSKFRQKLATQGASLELCLMGVVSGTCAALLIILFKLTIDGLHSLFMGDAQTYNDLSPTYRFFLPIIGALFILAVALLTGFKHYRMGIPFVIHRVKHFFGRIPFRTTINQFLGGAFAIASGFSVGREGPSVHLGASGSTFFGHWLRLPENSIRILSGCGIAAGISASFNTPFAAVIFVMEVVFREYKVHIFIPIMLAAACGSVLTRMVFGGSHDLSFIHFHEFSGWIYLYLILLGVFLGGLAALFNRSLMKVMHEFSRINMIVRLLLAAVITGAIGFVLPESLGASFDSAQQMLSQNASIQLLVAILCAKFVLTVVAIALGIPGGLMGPVFVIGMFSGVILAAPLGLFTSNSEQLYGSFSLLGMAGLMAAVVHAPLAALSAVMELSNTTALILPTILVVVPAYVTSTQVFKNKSIFIQQLDFQKLPYTISPVQDSLQKTGVLAVMSTQFEVLHSPSENPVNRLEDNPEVYFLLALDDGQTREYEWTYLDSGLDGESARLVREPLQGVKFQKTLAEVYAILAQERKGAVYIYEDSPENIVGVITWDSLSKHLHHASY